MRGKSIQVRTWEIVEVAKPEDRLSKIFDICILSLIFLNVLAVIIGSVDSIKNSCGNLLDWFEVISVVIFTLEYGARIWSCVIEQRYSRPIVGRLKFTKEPLPVIDLLAIVPFYLPFLGIDLRFIRVFRLLRVLRVAKIGRYYSSLRLIGNVIKSRKEELILTTVVMGLLLVISACLIYYCENQAQPDAFPNIPSTMWWSVVTLTTVGYGDVYPITVLGKILASIIAVLGIGMFALPTGIIGAGFVEEINKRKLQSSSCPHCGKQI